MSADATTETASPRWCATLSQQRGEGLAGTALHVRRLLLIEHDGPWPFHALEAEGLDPEVVGSLVDATRAAGARTLLIRRPHREGRRADVRCWAVVDVAAGLLTWGSWREADDLLAARDALAADSWDEQADRSAPGWGADPVVLVCTHGRHDACCAVRGRPLATALADRHGETVWECSHVGGDRFAGNVVVVPDGTFYGGLDEPADAVRVVGSHLRGAVDTSHLRGSAALPPAAQAVAVELVRRHGPAAPRAVLAHRIETLETGERARWRVRLECAAPLPARAVAVVAREPAGDAAFLTCQAPGPVVPQRYRVEDLRED